MFLFDLVRACKTNGEIIVNLKIQEEAISSSCLMLATPMRLGVLIREDFPGKLGKRNCVKVNRNYKSVCVYRVSVMCC